MSYLTVSQAYGFDTFDPVDWMYSIYIKTCRSVTVLHNRGQHRADLRAKRFNCAVVFMIVGSSLFMSLKIMFEVTLPVSHRVLWDEDEIRREWQCPHQSFQSCDGQSHWLFRSCANHILHWYFRLFLCFWQQFQFPGTDVSVCCVGSQVVFSQRQKCLRCWQRLWKQTQHLTKTLFSNSVRRTLFPTSWRYCCYFVCILSPYSTVRLKNDLALMLFTCLIFNIYNGEMIYIQHFLVVNNDVAVLAGYDPWRTRCVKRLVLWSSKSDS